MDPYLRRLQQEIDLAVAGLSADELRRHLPGKWCVAEILEHLYLSYTGTVRGFTRLLEVGNPLATAGTWKQRWQTVVIIGFGYMPSGRQAPSVARPRGLPSEKVLAEIGPKIAEMDGLITRGATQFGSNTRVLDHPILGPLSAAQWRKLHLVHGLHHLKQIRRLRSGVGLHEKGTP